MNSETPEKRSNHLLGAFKGWGFTWKGLLNNQKGEWWLFTQLVLLAGHLLPGWPKTTPAAPPITTCFSVAGSLFLSYGLALSIAAVFKLGASLSPLPDPKANARLITSGAYSYCRHPIYQALLMLSIGVTLLLQSILHLFLLMTLSAVLIGKAKREEKKLKVIHPKYSYYLSKTPAILPRVPLLDWRE